MPACSIMIHDKDLLKGKMKGMMLQAEFPMNASSPGTGTLHIYNIEKENPVIILVIR